MSAVKLTICVCAALLAGCLPDDPVPGGAVAANTSLPMHRAAEWNDFELARWALDQGFDINGGAIESKQGTFNITPLHYASRRGHAEMARFLLDHGADVNATTTHSDGRPDMRGTPLHAAARSANPQLVKLLVERGADINAGAEPALHGAIIKLRGKDWGSPASQRQKEIVNYLRTRPGAKTDNMQGFTELHWAALEADTEKAKSLILDGAIVNVGAFAWRSHDITPLHLAAESGNTDLAKLLLDHGASVNAKTKSGTTPLHWAAKEDSLPMVELLVKHGADFSAKDDKGRTALELYVGSADIRDYLKSLP